MTETFNCVPNLREREREVRGFNGFVQLSEGFFLAFLNIVLACFSACLNPLMRLGF